MNVETEAVQAGCDFTNGHVVKLINGGRQRAIRKGASEQKSTRELLNLYKEEFFCFYLFARYNFPGTDPHAIPAEKVPDECGNLQRMFVEVASLTHIAKLLLAKERDGTALGENIDIRSELRAATKTFKDDFAKRNPSRSRDNEKGSDSRQRITGLPTPYSLYANHGPHPTIRDHVIYAQTSPVKMRAELGYILEAFAAFATYPTHAVFVFDYRERRQQQQQRAGNQIIGRLEGPELQQQQQQQQQAQSYRPTALQPSGYVKFALVHLRS